MTARLVLDTSVFAHLRRGHEQVFDHLADAAVVVVPVTVIGELEAGFRAGTRYRENAHMLAEFLNEPFVTIADVTQETAGHYGQLFAALRAAGTPIPANDMWISAAALELQGQLLTFDRHFAVVPGLDATILSP